MNIGTVLAASLIWASAVAAQDSTVQHGTDGAHPPPAATPAPPFQPSRAVGGTHDCSSSYTRVSKFADEAGYVFLSYDVGADGAIVDVRLIGSSGYRRLDDAALACISQKWRNTPAMQGDVPVASPNHRVAIRYWLSGMPSEDGLFQRAVMELTQGQLEEALATFNAELALKPSSARAWRARSAVYEASGQHERAMEDVAKADALVNPR